MKRYVMAAAMAGMLFVAVGDALAIPVDVRYTGSSPRKDVRVYHPFGSGTYRVGVVQLDVDFGLGAERFEGFCVDLKQESSSQVQPYVLTALDAAPLDGGSPYSPMGGAKAEFIAELWGEHFDEIGTNSTKAAAFQLAVWEIIFENKDDGVETPNAWNSGAGRVRTTDSGVASVANGWLATLGDQSRTLESNLFAVANDTSSRTYQDYVIKLDTGGEPPVPEPLTMGSAILGLCGLGTYIRRRTVA